MAIPTYTVACTRKTLLAPDVYEFTFTKPEGFTFKPGQFVLFDVPHPDDRENIQTRAFSVASAPSETELLFAVKLLAGGRASRWFSEKVKEGTKAVIKGPFGNFVLPAQSDLDYLFIATGSGIAPFRSQVLALLEAGCAARIDIVFGVRAESDLFWHAEMREWATRYLNLFVHFALTQPSDAWTGHTGRVQTLVPLLVKDFSRTNIYVCGSPVMTNEVKKLALEQWGVDKKLLHVEGYI
jgi:ferredoxin-NADP reductase